MKNITVTNETTWQDEVIQQAAIEQALVFSSILEFDIYFSEEIKHDFKTLDDLEGFCNQNEIYCERLSVDIELGEGEPFDAIAVQNFSGELRDALK